MPLNPVKNNSIGTSILSWLAPFLKDYFKEEINRENVASSQVWQEKMIDQSNEYNSPVNQVQRLKDAGINPSVLGMGNGMSISGNTSSNPISSPALPAFDSGMSASNEFSKLASGYLGLEQGLSDKTFRQARLDNLQAENDNLKVNSELLGLNADNQRVINQYTNAKESLALLNGRAQFDLTYSQRNKANQEVANLRYTLYNLLPEEKRKLVSETDNNILNLDYLSSQIIAVEAGTEKTKAETGLITEQVTSEQIKQEGLDLENRGQSIENQYQGEVFEKMIEQYSASISKIMAETGLTEEQAFWYVFEVADKNANRFMGSKIGMRAYGNTVRTNAAVKRAIQERTR